MAPRLNNSIIIVILVFSISSFSQEDNTKPRRIIDYKNDSSYLNFSELHVKVAKAQINLLKNGGALLVRLKTNKNTIEKLKTAGNIDLATQVQRETHLRNKNIVRAYLKEFKFCPVYFFYSDYSDSVKHKNLSNIFLDSNLTINSSIICKAGFYLIAEQGAIYESSLGIVSESRANTAIERGTPSKEVSIVIKNRYFIQLHKPFPYYQRGYSLKKRYADYVEKINVSLEKYYEKNKGYTMSPELAQYVY